VRSELVQGLALRFFHSSYDNAPSCIASSLSTVLCWGGWKAPMSWLPASVCQILLLNDCSSPCVPHSVQHSSAPPPSVPFPPSLNKIKHKHRRSFCAALLVFKEGALTAKSLVAKFTKDGTLLQEQVSWLHACLGVGLL